MVLLILAILHILGDFYFQTNNMVNKKSESVWYVLLHSFLYTLPFICFFVFIDIANKTKISIIGFAIILISHFFVDWLKTFLEKKFVSPKVRLTVFICDQVIHLGLIFVFYLVTKLENLLSAINIVFIGKTISTMNLVVYTLLILLIINPAAVLVKKVFALLETENDYNKGFDNSINTNSRAGKIIGILERLITMMLILVNQYSVLGLVLTAKSIARFKDFEKAHFAEKYLIGTLVSLSIAFGATILLKKFLV